MNRVWTSRLAAVHFAPTTQAAANLVSEGISSEICVTGNTGIDALLRIRGQLECGRLTASGSGSRNGRRMVLVTAHRRESVGDGFIRICSALARLAARGDVDLVFPVHPNPNVRRPVEQLLGSEPGIQLIDPLEYVSFVDLMR